MLDMQKDSSENLTCSDFPATVPLECFPLIRPEGGVGGSLVSFRDRVRQPKARPTKPPHVFPDLWGIFERPRMREVSGHGVIVKKELYG